MILFRSHLKYFDFHTTDVINKQKDRQRDFIKMETITDVH